MKSDWKLFNFVDTIVHADGLAQSGDTALLCAKFQNIWATEMGVMD